MAGAWRPPVETLGAAATGVVREQAAARSASRQREKRAFIETTNLGFDRPAMGKPIFRKVLFLAGASFFLGFFDGLGKMPLPQSFALRGLGFS